MGVDGSGSSGSIADPLFVPVRREVPEEDVPKALSDGKIPDPPASSAATFGNRHRAEHPFDLAPGLAYA